MPELFPVTLEEMIAEVRRELHMRQRVYTDMVAHGRMNRRQADRRIDVMAATLAYLEKQQAPAAENS